MDKDCILQSFFVINLVEMNVHAKRMKKISFSEITLSIFTSVLY